MRPLTILHLAIAAVGLSACGDDPPTQPSTPGLATVRIVYRGATALRSDLPASAQACVNGVGQTHTHPSWREFQAFALTPVPPDRYEIVLNDAPVGMTLSFRVNDRNWCDVNPTGAVLRDVLVNNVAMVQNTLTPGSGQEPGYAFTVTQDGRVMQ
jgi:uncharacterized repeat protein (TIGR01451 family)